MCDSSLPICPPECEGTGKAALALLAFATVLIALACLFVLKRIILGDSMVYYKLTYPLHFVAAFYTAAAAGLHGGWCYYNINHDLRGTGIDPTHGVGFGCAVAAFVFSLWAGILSKKFTYLTYAPTTYNPQVAAI